MTAPYLSPRLHLITEPARAVQPELAAQSPLVPTLEVRLGSTRPRRYALQDARLTIGGIGCDVVLPETTVPPLVAEMHARNGGHDFELTRIDPAFPILVNGHLFRDDGPVLLHHGDRVAVGAVDLTIQNPTVHIHPEFTPPTASNFYHQQPSHNFSDEREELNRLRQTLASQAEELEADRVLWYRRRAQMEQETTTHEATLQREQALLQFQQDLEKSRQDLAEQFRQRKEQLTRMQEALDGSAASLTAQRRQFEDEAARRTAEMEHERRARLSEVEAELRRRRDELEAELEAKRLSLTLHETAAVRQGLLQQPTAPVETEETRQERERYREELVRLERRQTLLDDRERTLNAREDEAARLRDECTRRELEHEEQQVLLNSERETLTGEQTAWELRKREHDQREEKVAEREQLLEAQQAKLAVLRAGLERQQEELNAATARLAQDRIQLDEARTQREEQLREAEALRLEFASLRDDRGEQTRLAQQRAAELEVMLAEAQQQRDTLATERETLRRQGEELDQRTAALAEQTGELQARAKQFSLLQEQHEAEKTALAQRLQSLNEADAVRQTFQEQLRRRNEELSARAKALDEATRRLTVEQAACEQLRAELDQERGNISRGFIGEETELRKLTDELEAKTQSLLEREANIDRQATRLREVGKLVADEKRKLAESRTLWENERAAAKLSDEKTQAEFQSFYTRAHEEFATLRTEAPELFDRAQATMERLEAAREVIRARLGELHGYAGESRADLDRVRAELHVEIARLEERERNLEAARAEHRLAVAEFRSQATEWQANLTAFQQASEREAQQRLARDAELEALNRDADETTIRLARRAEELDAEKAHVSQKRSEVELHLNDMREWYRRKLKDLTKTGAPASPALLSISGRNANEEPDPGDKHLGETLKRLELVDAETLDSLWSEARQQRRPLRQLLLNEGAVTLYQLAMIESNQLNALMLGRLRVIDRPRVTPRESVFRVLDPSRLDWSTKGVFLLRHLSEAEMDDAVRPDEFRQQFAAAREAAHPNMAAVVEVLEIQNRPAAMLEYIQGLPSSDWPAEAGIPGLWLRLLSDAAKALDAAHRHGLVHGRLSSESFVLTNQGELKLIGIGEPWWLTTGTSPTSEPSIEADLRALGQVAYGWSRLGRPVGVRRSRVMPFPESLSAVIRRLESDPETPMADTATGAMPYHSAAELVADLNRLAAIIPVPPEARTELQRKLREALDQPATRQSA